MDPRSIDELVLATVNAPYRATTSANDLAAAIRAADPWGLPQLHSLFSDVAPRLTFQFAAQHGIPFDELRSAYKSFLARGGLPYPNFEEALEKRALIRGRAITVFEDEGKADSWLDHPLAVLGNRSPSQVAEDSPETVLNILERIAWGVPP